MAERFVPVISLKDFDERKEEIISQLLNAAEYAGFFTLVDHGISKEEIEAQFAISKAFFDLPPEDKAKTPHDPKTNNGWEYKAQLRASTGTYDQKESLWLQRNSEWPSDGDVPNFRDSTTQFMSKCAGISDQVLSCFAIALGFGENYFRIANDPTQADCLTQLRLIHYPASENAVGTWRAGSHTDIGCLTLLFQRDGEDGLEICPGRESHSSFASGDVFTPLPAETGPIVVNIGDMLMAWSDDRLKSNYHRVRAKDVGKSPSRYSIAYFNQARRDISLQGPLKKYPPMTVVYVGETSSRSFLHFLRRTTKGYIGSVPFTDEERHHVAIEPESSTLDMNPAHPSPEEAYLLLSSYLEATSGVLDLFTPDELDRLMAERSSENATVHYFSKVDLEAAFNLALAIGAQARGRPEDVQLSKAYFLRAREIAFEGMLMSQNLNTVRHFVLLAFYTLGACNRNAASMFLTIAAKAAVILGLHSSENDSDLPEEDQSTSGDDQNAQSLFTAMAKACILLEEIVDTLGKSNNILHVPTAEGVLERLRQWSRGLPQNIRRFPHPSANGRPLDAENRRVLLGSIHVSCVYYFAVILITRPFLVAYLMSRLRGKAPDHLISDPEEASDINIKNNKVSRLAQVCVGSAITMVETCVKAKALNFTFGNLCLIEAWIFGAGLVLGFSMFAAELRKDIEAAFADAHDILGDIALASPQAQLYHNMLTDFAEAIAKYRQRVSDETHYTVQHYMDRILIFEPPTDGNAPGPPDDYESGRNVDETWGFSLANPTQANPFVFPMGLTAANAADEMLRDQHDGWLDGSIHFPEFFVPELEPFDQLFYTVE
ncbi:Oxoglutarate/iron-dependent dioxygenase [Penicillium expansum]|nr:Oxoglutarate/iron-dependent dioxygenase [Penicillium expansum]KGO51841.1 Oxoglutarate/iron-dependent dioxygenase [Penicillium expansum]